MDLHEDRGAVDEYPEELGTVSYKAVYEVVRALPPKERAKILEALGKTLSRADTAN